MKNITINKLKMSEKTPILIMTRNETPMIRLKRNIEKLRQYDWGLGDPDNNSPARVSIDISDDIYYTIYRCIGNDERIIYAVGHNFRGGCLMSQTTEFFDDFDDLMEHLVLEVAKHSIDLNNYDENRFHQKFVEGRKIFRFSMIDYLYGCV
jgi:hypothetical protein